MMLIGGETAIILTRHGSDSYNQTLNHSIQGECWAQDGHAVRNVLPHLLLFPTHKTNSLVKDALHLCPPYE